MRCACGRHRMCLLSKHGIALIHLWRAPALAAHGMCNFNERRTYFFLRGHGRVSALTSRALCRLLGFACHRLSLLPLKSGTDDETDMKRRVRDAAPGCC